MSSIPVSERLIAQRLLPLNESNPVHRALFNADIFQPIARILYCMGGQEGIVTLACLARTCRGFFHDSVALLWKNMDTIAPLLQTIRGIEWDFFIVECGSVQWVRGTTCSNSR